MNPEVNLAEIRATRQALKERLPRLSCGTSATAVVAIVEMERLLSLIEAQDNWLTNGGALPVAWDHKAQRCSTIGCRNGVAVELTWRYQSGDPVTELVCEDCGNAFARRPALQATIKRLEAKNREGYGREAKQ